ncbi:MAG: four helix bundle protein [Deltaproteobacteria bacterium]|nr:four helix bundle protein [Deltaproteobacteria bacterium]
MGLIIQQRALAAAGGLRQILPVVRKRDRSLFDQIHRAMNSVVLNIAEADGNDAGTARARFASACGSAKEVRAGLQLGVAYGYFSSAKVQAVDATLDLAVRASAMFRTTLCAARFSCSASDLSSSRIV